MSDPCSPQPAIWRREIRERLAAHWALKTVGITGFMLLFFAGYFYTLNSPARPVTIVPAVWLDEMIGFQPWALLPYGTLWIYVSLAPGLLKTRRALTHYALPTTLLAVAGLAIFSLWPTAIVPPEIDWTDHPAFAFLKTIDASGNACPSLHVAFAIFTACRLSQVLHTISVPAWVRATNWLWAIAIVYSTLATKQHVTLDALAGTAFGLAAHYSFQRAGTD